MKQDVYIIPLLKYISRANLKSNNLSAHSRYLKYATLPHFISFSRHCRAQMVEFNNQPQALRPVFMDKLKFQLKYPF